MGLLDPIYLGVEYVYVQCQGTEFKGPVLEVVRSKVGGEFGNCMWSGWRGWGACETRWNLVDCYVGLYVSFYINAEERVGESYNKYEKWSGSEYYHGYT